MQYQLWNVFTNLPKLEHDTSKAICLSNSVEMIWSRCVKCMSASNSEHIVSDLDKDKCMDFAWRELLDLRTIQC